MSSLFNIYGKILHDFSLTQNQRPFYILFVTLLCFLTTHTVYIYICDLNYQQNGSQ